MTGSQKRLLRDIYAHFKGRTWLLIALMAITGITEGLAIALLLPLLPLIGIGGTDASSTGGHIITELVNRLFSLLGITPDLLSLTALVIIAALCQFGLMLLQVHTSSRMQHDYAATWRRELFATVLRARMSHLNNRKNADFVNAIVTETNRLSGAFYLVFQLAGAAVVGIIFIGMALAISPAAVVLLVVAGAILASAARGAMRRTRDVGERLGYLNNDLQGMSSEFLSSAKFIKATATEGRVEEKVARVVDQLRDAFYISSFAPHAVRAMFEFAALVILCLILVFGISALSIAPPQILIILALFIRLFPRLAGMQQNYQLLSVYIPAIDLAENMMNEARAAEETNLTTPTTISPPPFFKAQPISLHLEGVTAGYGDQAILRDINLTFPAGMTIGLVGASGAGKSTLIDSLLGFVDISQGHIRINGQDMMSLPLAAWRRSVGYVPQEAFLLHASIRENLLWSFPDASEEDMIHAAKRAAAHDFIQSLPDGYDTIVGDRGLRLSGGQRQRLSLARALVGQPALLILDEATSALDSHSENEVLKAFEALRGNITIIMIAHRLSTLKATDQIHVMADGHVQQSGTWDELLGSQGHFRDLWLLQASVNGDQE